MLAAALALSYPTLLISSFPQGYFLIDQNGHETAKDFDLSAAGTELRS
jgi:hypothetical protein